MTLLNTDYKIATKAMAMRLKTELISKDYSSMLSRLYIKGRYIGDVLELFPT